MGPLDNRPPRKPIHSKVAAGTVGGACGILVTWLLVSVGVEVPTEVGGAISTLCGFVLAFREPSSF